MQKLVHISKECVCKKESSIDGWKCMSPYLGDVRCWHTGVSVHYNVISLQKKNKSNLLLLVTDPVSCNRSLNGRNKKL